MNARLLIRLLHRPVLVPTLAGLPGATPPERALPRQVPERRPVTPPAERELPTPPLQLLGEGHDAILLRYRHGVPLSPSTAERLLRYVRALYCRDISTADARMADLRRRLGEKFQLAWADGQRPDLRHGKPAIRIRTHRPQRAGTTIHRSTP